MIPEWLLAHKIKQYGNVEAFQRSHNFSGICIKSCYQIGQRMRNKMKLSKRYPLVLVYSYFTGVDSESAELDKEEAEKDPDNLPALLSTHLFHPSLLAAQLLGFILVVSNLAVFVCLQWYYPAVKFL